LRVAYQPEQAATEFAKAKANARVPDSILGEPATVEIGNAEDTIAAASHKVDLLFHTPRYNHNAIELHAATVAWDGDMLVVHDATQVLSQAAWSLAQVFGLKEDQVRVLSPYVGGGFGGKTLWYHQVLAAAAAKLAARPV